MAQRWVVSDGTFAQQVSAARIAIGGVVKDIPAALVSHEGFARKFFPTAGGLADSRIVWDTTALTVTKTAIDPEDSSAIITFNRDTGLYTYNDSPDADVSGVYLNPPVTGANQYLIKVEQVSGTALTGTLGSWIDLNSAATHEWSLDQTVVGLLGAVGDISIAADAGGGVPDLATIVTKAVTFSSEVTAGAGIAWSDVARALVEETESVDADCDLIFNPDGSCVGSADTSGAFNENWHSDAPSPAAPGDFTVNATLVSGTAPAGSALATNLTLDTVRQWTLLATSGEDLTCALDITVSDGVDSITKRVTMNSVRSSDASDNTWTTTQWQLVDTDTSAPVGTVNINADGSATGTIESPPQTEETEAWNSASPAAPDPEDYEVFLHNVAGLAGLIAGSDIETWIPLSVNRSWSVTITSGLYREWVWDISIRRVGRVAVTKRVYVDLGTEGTE